MLSWLSKLYNWLAGLWASIPESVKEKIIITISESFEAMFREYYRSEKNKREKNG